MNTTPLCILLLFWVEALCYSQSKIIGRFVGLDRASLDSAKVLLKDGTGDTTYFDAPVSRDGIFSLSTRTEGTFLADISCPGYKNLQVALLLDKPITDTIVVILSPTSRPHEESRVIFGDSTSIVARFASRHLEMNLLLARYIEQRSEFLHDGGRPSDFKFDWKGGADRLVSALAQEKEPILRQELIMQYIMLRYTSGGAGNTSADSLEKWDLEIPALSPAWVYYPSAAYVAVWYHRGKFEYINKMIAEYPNRYLRANLLYGKAGTALAPKTTKSLRRQWSSFRANIPTPDMRLQHFCIDPNFGLANRFLLSR
jgi:hypothetical protein